MAGLNDLVSPVHFDIDTEDARLGSDLGLAGFISDVPARVTQEAIEPAVLSSDQRARITQAVIEPTTLPSDQLVRITQGLVEPAVWPTSEKIRLTQVAVETVSGDQRWSLDAVYAVADYGGAEVGLTGPPASVSLTVYGQAEGLGTSAKALPTYGAAYPVVVLPTPAEAQPYPVAVAVDGTAAGLALAQGSPAAAISTATTAATLSDSLSGFAVRVPSFARSTAVFVTQAVVEVLTPNV